MNIDKKYFYIFGWSFFFAVIINVWYYQDYSGKTLKYWVQEDNPKYYDHRYRLSVIETTRATGLFTTKERHYQIFISKQSVKPELDMMYGHYKEYGFEGNRKKVEETLENCSVRWGKGGVWFVDDTGHRLFFPKETFMGGR